MNDPDRCRKCGREIGDDELSHLILTEVPEIQVILCDGCFQLALSRGVIKHPYLGLMEIEE